MTIADRFTECHRQCDDAWAEVERAAGAGDVAAAAVAFEAFDMALRQHLHLEEKVLFPALEEAGLPVPGPTEVMRAEHRQMRALADRMSAASLRRDLGDLLDAGDTLLFVTQQHNEKEEGLLYPMADRLLGAVAEALHAQFDAAGGCGRCGCEGG